jgi:hypothetical protein
MRTDRQTDTTKVIVAFRNFTNAPKNGSAVGSTAPICKNYRQPPTTEQNLNVFAICHKTMLLEIF